MKKKRPTHKRLPSGSWRVQVMVNGERVSITDPDPNVAQARAMALQAGIIERGKKTTSMTLEQAIDRYIEDRYGVLSPSTIRGYGFIRDKRFPALMPMDIRAITKRDLQTAVNRETAAGVSAKTHHRHQEKTPWDTRSQGVFFCCSRGFLLFPCIRL